VDKVAKNSVADQAGFRPGDVLEQVGTTRTRSQGDVMWALRLAPEEGRLDVTVLREAKRQKLFLELSPGWRKPDLSWRRSVSKLKK
jgi:S1-C subfamily serine protease